MLTVLYGNPFDGDLVTDDAGDTRETAANIITLPDPTIDFDWDAKYMIKAEPISPIIPAEVAPTTLAPSKPAWGEMETCSLLAWARANPNRSELKDYWGVCARFINAVNHWGVEVRSTWDCSAQWEEKTREERYG